VSQQTEQDQQQKVDDLIRRTRLAMLTSVDPDGRLVSMPMATQDVEFHGEVWFIAERDSHKVRNIDTFTDAWLEGGPENPNNILVRVTGTSAEYWDTPGSKVVRVANLVKAKVTGSRYDGDNESVDLDQQG
jgi:general stress protein 26